MIAYDFQPEVSKEAKSTDTQKLSEYISTTWLALTQSGLLLTRFAM